VWRKYGRQRSGADVLDSAPLAVAGPPPLLYFLPEEIKKYRRRDWTLRVQQPPPVAASVPGATLAAIHFVNMNLRFIAAKLALRAGGGTISLSSLSFLYCDLGHNKERGERDMFPPCGNMVRRREDTSCPNKFLLLSAYSGQL